MTGPDLSLLSDCQAWMCEALEGFHESQWEMWDRALILVERYQRPELRAIMEGLGRSHQDLLRWAEYARLVPEDVRRPDVSPLYQARKAKEASLSPGEG